MTTTIIAPAATTETTIDPQIGRWTILCDGEQFGPHYTFKDIAAGVVESARKLCPTSAWELVNGKGERVPVDACEAFFLKAQDEFESREVAEGWVPSACAYCDGQLGSLDTLDDFRFLAVNDPACLGCLQGMAESHAVGCA